MEQVGSPVLRPALELAWVLARKGLESVPPEPVPAPLRPLLRFSHLPERALDTVRGAVDDDGDFRLRVAAAADESRVGRLAWVWLARPEGWEVELAEAAASAAAARHAENEARDERTAARRVPALQARIVALEEAAVEGRRRLERAGAELSAERTARRLAEGRLGASAQVVEDALQAVQEAERRAARAAALAEDARTQTAAAQARLGRLQADHDALVAELDAAREAVGAARQAEDDRDREARIRGSALAGAVADAGAAAARLGDALAEAAALLGPGPSPAPAAPPDPAQAAPAPRSAPAPRRRRRPVPLPGGVWDDSVEAAVHLFRTPGALVIVDGYNVTLSTTWSGRELVDQRHRLVGALGEAALRTGAVVEVVFDGADDGVRVAAGPGGRAPVRVVFSPVGVDADDVIIERVGSLPPTAPVVVATDDRRVRDAVRSEGANLIGTAQLLQALGRWPGRRS